MERLITIKKAIQLITRLIAFGGMFLLIPMMLLTTADVIGRAIWAWPIQGTVDLSSYMLAVFILLGVAYTQQVKGHVRVDILTARLPERVSLILDAITNFFSLFIISLLTWQGWAVGIKERTVSDMLRIPQYPFRLLVSLAGFFLFLELLIDLVAIFRKLRR